MEKATLVDSVDHRLGDDLEPASLPDVRADARDERPVGGGSFPPAVPLAVVFSVAAVTPTAIVAAGAPEKKAGAPCTVLTAPASCAPDGVELRPVRQRILAERILEAARGAGVPVRSDPALAEALAKLELGYEIPEELCVVAEALAWAYGLDARALSRAARLR